MNKAKTNQLAKKMTKLCKQYAQHSLPLMPLALVAIIIGLWKGIGLADTRQRGWTRG